MDIFVHNLAYAATEKEVKDFFQVVLRNFGIHTFHFQKLQSGGCAIITIIDTSRAELFLRVHGQETSGERGFKYVAQKLHHFGRQVQCRLSNTGPDPFYIRTLAKEENDRRAATSRQSLVVPGITRASRPEPTRRALEISQIECGKWDYLSENLTFSSEFSEWRRGRILFTGHNVFIKLVPLGPEAAAHQMEIPFNSIDSFTIGPQSNPCITLSLSEAPSFYEADKSVGEAMSALDLRPQISKSANRIPNQNSMRNRVSALETRHQDVVASCLCYRFMMLNPLDLEHVRRLRRFPEIPASIYWNTNSISKQSFKKEMDHLNSALAGDKYSMMSFDMKFQLQKLGQNGCLPPPKVMDLAEIALQHLVQGTEGKIVATALQRLASQIPFAGPDTQAADLELAALARLLCDAEEALLYDENHIVTLADQYDHILNVHKAIVTPTGIYLYGPEPEVKNRVTRKYSQFPNHFLSVSFRDENGEK